MPGPSVNEVKKGVFSLPEPEDFAAPLDESFRAAADGVLFSGGHDMLPTPDDVTAVGYYLQGAYNRLNPAGHTGKPDAAERYEQLLNTLDTTLQQSDLLERLRERLEEGRQLAEASKPPERNMLEMLTAKTGIGKALERRRAKQARMVEIQELKEKAKTNGNKIRISDLKPDDELVFHMLHHHSSCGITGELRGTIVAVQETEDGSPIVKIKVAQEKWKVPEYHSDEKGRKVRTWFSPPIRPRGSTTVLAGSMPLMQSSLSRGEERDYLERHGDWSKNRVDELVPAGAELAIESSIAQKWQDEGRRVTGHWIIGEEASKIYDPERDTQTIGQGEALQVVEGNDVVTYGDHMRSGMRKYYMELDQLTVNGIDVFAPRVWVRPPKEKQIGSEDCVRHPLAPSYHK